MILADMTIASEDVTGISLTAGCKWVATEIFLLETGLQLRFSKLHLGYNWEKIHIDEFASRFVMPYELQLGCNLDLDDLKWLRFS
jgi:hypothetical protein